MNIHNWKNNELNRLLMEKFNLGEGEYNRSKEEEEEEALEESSCSATHDDKEECPDCGKKHGNHILYGEEAKKPDDKKDSKNESFRRAVRKLMEEVLKLK